MNKRFSTHFQQVWMSLAVLFLGLVAITAAPTLAGAQATAGFAAPIARLTSDHPGSYPFDYQAFFPYVGHDYDAFEARVRVILADSQLGGVIDNYRQYIIQPVVAEAVLRWDAGVRVVNIDSFERAILPEIGWAVVYAGTGQAINGMSVVLTSDVIPPFDNEAQVRYILADSQLGGVIDYYRQFTEQPNVAEAVRRWDLGVRVVNYSNFERVDLPETGWAVVYAGTTEPIDGMDVVLTTDPPPAE